MTTYGQSPYPRRDRTPARPLMHEQFVYADTIPARVPTAAPEPDGGQPNHESLLQQVLASSRSSTPTSVRSSLSAPPAAGGRYTGSQFQPFQQPDSRPATAGPCQQQPVIHPQVQQPQYPQPQYPQPAEMEYQCRMAGFLRERRSCEALLGKIDSLQRCDDTDRQRAAVLGKLRVLQQQEDQFVAEFINRMPQGGLVQQMGPAYAPEQGYARPHSVYTVPQHQSSPQQPLQPLQPQQQCSPQQRYSPVQRPQCTPAYHPEGGFGSTIPAARLPADVFELTRQMAQMASELQALRAQKSRSPVAHPPEQRQHSPQPNWSHQAKLQDMQLREQQMQEERVRMQEERQRVQQMLQELEQQKQAFELLQHQRSAGVQQAAAGVVISQQLLDEDIVAAHLQEQQQAAQQLQLPMEQLRKLTNGNYSRIAPQADVFARTVVQQQGAAAAACHSTSMPPGEHPCLGVGGGVGGRVKPSVQVPMAAGNAPAAAAATTPTGVVVPDAVTRQALFREVAIMVSTGAQQYAANYYGVPGAERPLECFCPQSYVDVIGSNGRTYELKTFLQADGSVRNQKIVSHGGKLHKEPDQLAKVFKSTSMWQQATKECMMDMVQQGYITQETLPRWEIFTREMNKLLDMFQRKNNLAGFYALNQHCWWLMFIRGLPADADGGRIDTIELLTFIRFEPKGGFQDFPSGAPRSTPNSFNSNNTGVTSSGGNGGTAGSNTSGSSAGAPSSQQHGAKPGGGGAVATAPFKEESSEAGQAAAVRLQPQQRRDVQQQPQPSTSAAVPAGEGVPDVSSSSAATAVSSVAAAAVVTDVEQFISRIPVSIECLPDDMDYGDLLGQFPPLVAEMVTTYPFSRIKKSVSKVSVSNAASAAEQLEWFDLAECEHQDALEQQRMAASLEPHQPSPSSRDCRVETPSEVTSGSRPGQPEWSAGTLEWVSSVMSHWPLQPGHIGYLFADDPECQQLVQWAREGVPIVHPGHTVPGHSCSNYPTAPNLVDMAATAAQQELLEHHVVVPPAMMHSPWVHATGSVAKGPAAAPTGARRIHDFARPSGAAVNDHVRYISRPFTTARTFAEQVKQHGWMAKLDIHSYFHQFGACPQHWPFLAFRVPAQSIPEHLRSVSSSSSTGQGEVEVWGNRMLFGLRHGPEVADRFSQSIVRLVRRMGWQITYAFLDDFNIYDDDQLCCLLGWHFLCAVVLHCGLLPSLGKSALPAQIMQTLGLEIDTCRMQLRLTQSRVQQLQQLVQEFSSRKKCTKRELDSVAGKRQWASDVIFGGTLLLNPIRRCGLKCRKPHHKVYLCSEARLALSWWREALQHFNGQRHILQQQPEPWQLLTTDACGIWDTAEPGIGIFVAGEFCGLTAAQCHSMFPDAPAVTAPIQLWELFAIVAMARLYSSWLQGKYLQIGVDNLNVCSWLSKGTVRGDVCYQQALAYLLDLFKMQLDYNFRLQPHWISSETNVLADAASRREWSVFRSALQQWVVQQDNWSGPPPSLQFLQHSVTGTVVGSSSAAG